MNGDQARRGWTLAAVLAVAVSLLAALAAALPPAAALDMPAVLIDSVYYDGFELNDADEAVALRNAGGAPVDVSGWVLGDGSSEAALPAGALLTPGQVVWLAHDAAAFRRQFGTEPDILMEKWPGFANSGDEVLLTDAGGKLVETVLYGGGDTATAGWSGPAVQPYTVSGVFAAEGQILFRLRDPASGRPLADTNSAADWAQTRDDPLNGRRVRYPGWRADEFFFPAVITPTGVLTIAVAPDNAFAAVVAAFNAARISIDAAALTAENAALGDALAAAARRGVAVRLLLEGAPAGGLTDQERFVCATIEAASGACWFMAGDDALRVHSRYRYMHAKYALIDGAVSVVSTENFSPDSLPDDDKTDGTWGRRGVVLLSDEPALAAHLERLFAADLDPAFSDLVRWRAGDPVYGEPPPGFIPVRQTGGMTYTVRYRQPASYYGAERIEVIQSPENSLRPDGLLGLINRAGEGDTLLAQQLSERPHWGMVSSNPVADPNPRLEALIRAAERGATVKIMLDSFFDEPDSPASNRATCDRVNAIGHAEGLRLACVTANPTGLGIHNKMVLARVGEAGYVLAGSLNGTELSYKGNRELSLLIQSDAAYAYLADLFERDWPHLAYLPLALVQPRGAAAHLLITEVDYNPPGLDDAEYIEIANPTALPVDLTPYRIGDATTPEDFEDMRHFPPGLVIQPGQALVVATSATAFTLEYGYPPDLEVLSTDPVVPDLIDDPAWGDPAAFLQLGNLGDEVYLCGDKGVIVDMIAYGASPHAPVCPLVVPPNRVLERFPYWLDTDNCPKDFRSSAFPNPGQLP